MLQVSDRLLLSCYQSLNNYPYLNIFLSETKDSTFGRTNWNTTSYCLYTSWYKSRHGRGFFPLIIRILNKIRSFYQVSSLKLLNNSIQVYNRDTEIMRKNVQTGIKLFLLILLLKLFGVMFTKEI